MVNIKILSGFNNYYNRQVKLPGNQLVINYSPYVIYEETGVNFVPNDGVNTQHVFGNQLNSYDGTGDYLLVVSEDNQIDSRWFIIESVRDRAGQFTLTLHRDLVADYFNQVIDRPMFIEKATLSESDPFILNKEPNFTVNQIKTQEYKISDKTKVPWIVGFLNREWSGFSTDTYTADIKLSNPPVFRSYVGTLEQSDIYRNERSAYSTQAWTVQIYLKVSPSYGTTKIPCLFTLSSYNTRKEWEMKNISEEEYQNSGSTLTTSLTSSQVISALNNSTYNASVLQMAYDNYITYKSSSNTSVEILLGYDGKVISTDNGTKYWKIEAVSSVGTTVFGINGDITSIGTTPALKTYLTNLVGASGSGGLKVQAVQPSVSLNFNPTQQASFTLTMATKENREILDDAPYDMFCIPYQSLLVEKGSTSYVTLGEQETLSIAQQLAEKLGTNLYDIQLLPYCPMRYLDVTYLADGSKSIIDLDNLTENSDYTLQEVGSNSFVMFWSRTSKGSISVYDTLFLDKDNTLLGGTTSVPSDLEEHINVSRKIANECNMFRLCSPNYNGTFEFNTSKMNVDNWVGYSVDYTYLPYSSYIHVNPDFAGLYGQDYNDARGLICQGDFSISYLSDAWVNYQIQNKNYANIFNRQIQNMELTQSVQRDQQIFNAISGTVMGGAAGATMGAKGGVGGAIAGGIIGGVMSGIGGALDVGYGDLLRNEALDYKKDLFAYQLDNIKALPDSIAKVTAYNENNKLFPTLEFYTCTDEEKQALANKIAWNGMTTMRIGTMSQFIGNNWNYGNIESEGYIKGKLIRLDTIGDDYHIVNALSGELDKGVYIK